MKAVKIEVFGKADVLKLVQVPDPELKPTSLLLRVRASGVNRADILQRLGFYPPPAGESEIPGLEIAGEVIAMGSKVEGFQLGDRVFGLVSGGGYAQLCLLDYRLAMVIPDSMSFVQAAAVTEVFYTAGETLFHTGGLQAGERVLIHAGGSGVGTAAIQMAHHVGAEVYVTAGSEQKLNRCVQLGADVAINYKNDDFKAVIQEKTKGEGVNLILDFIGAAYLQRNLESLAPLGRMVVVGLLGGLRAELDLALVLRKRLQLLGSVMRSLELTEKRAIHNRFCERWLPLIEQKVLKPIIHCEIPFEKAAEAHKLMEASEHFGKLVLTVSD